VYNKIHIVEAVSPDKEEAGRSLPTCERENNRSKEFTLSLLECYMCWDFWRFRVCMKVEKISSNLACLYLAEFGVQSDQQAWALAHPRHASTVRNVVLLIY